MALAPFMIYYSTEARANMLLMAVVLLSTLSLVYGLEKGRVGWWVAYAIFTSAAAYTHYTVIFVLVGQFVWAYFTHPQARRALVGATAAAGLAFLPWLSQLESGLGQPNAIGFYQPFGIRAIELYIPLWSLGTQYISLNQLPGYLAVGLVLAGLTLGVFSLALRWRGTARRWAPLPPKLVLVVVLAMATPAGAAVYSSVAASVFDPRDLIASWPGLALLIGAVTTSGRIPFRLVATGLVLAGFAVGSAKMLAPEYQRPNINAVASYISRVGYSGDPIVDVPQYAYPLSELDVALDGIHGSTKKVFPVFRLGVPQRDQMTSAALLHGNASPPNLHPTSPESVALRASVLAKHGIIFYIAGPTPLRDYAYFPKSPYYRFLRSIAPRFHLIRQVDFGGGFGGLFPTSVFEFGANLAQPVRGAP